MLILPDTNILFSALLFPKSVPAQVLQDIIDRHTFALCKPIVNELVRIVEEKMPQRTDDVQRFLVEEQSVFLLDVPQSTNAVSVRDVNDQSILDIALSNKVDVLVTGDKDFLSLPPLSSLHIVSARQYYDQYISETAS